MSDKTCDHTSVGMLVWNDDKLLLIERKKPPFGFAPPAGHVDGDPSYEVSAKRELQEEVGLDAKSLELVLEADKSNPCRRKDGAWHHWKIYRVVASGKLKPSQDETKQAGWFTVAELQALAAKTQAYIRGDITESAWQQQPGLEPVWYDSLKELKIM